MFNFDVQPSLVYVSTVEAHVFVAWAIPVTLDSHCLASKVVTAILMQLQADTLRLG